MPNKKHYKIILKRLVGNVESLIHFYGWIYNNQGWERMVQYQIEVEFPGWEIDSVQELDFDVWKKESRVPI